MDEPGTHRPSVLARLEDGVLVAMVTVLLLVSFGQILLRNLFQVTPLWIEPLARHLVMWTGFLGALAATREGRHIRIDAVLRLLPPLGRAAALLLSGAVSALTCGVLAWVAFGFVADERRYGAVGFLDLPTWILQVIFPACFALMACRYASGLAPQARDLARQWTRRGEPS